MGHSHGGTMRTSRASAPCPMKSRSEPAGGGARAHPGISSSVSPSPAGSRPPSRPAPSPGRTGWSRRFGTGSQGRRGARAIGSRRSCAGAQGGRTILLAPPAGRRPRRSRGLATSPTPLPPRVSGGPKRWRRGAPSQRRPAADGIDCPEAPLPVVLGRAARLEGFRCSPSRWSISRHRHHARPGRPAPDAARPDRRPGHPRGARPVARRSRRGDHLSTDDLGSSSLAIDIASMRHEWLEPRIFRS